MVPPLGRGVSDGLSSDVADAPNQAGADDLGLHGMIPQAILVPFPQPRHVLPESSSTQRKDQDHEDGSRAVVACRSRSQFADGIMARREILHLLSLVLCPTLNPRKVSSLPRLEIGFNYGDHHPRFSKSRTQFHSPMRKPSDGRAQISHCQQKWNRMIVSHSIPF